MPHHEGYQEALRRIAACRASGAEELDLGGLQLEEIPPELLELSWLKQLYLGAAAEARKNAYLIYQNLNTEELRNTYHMLPESFSTAFAQLEFLDLSYSLLASLTPLEGLTNLTMLECVDTQVSDLKPLQRLTKLITLNCSGTQVSDLKPLKHLQSLKTLNFSDTQVRDLKPLQRLISLKIIECVSTKINNLIPLQRLEILEKIDCSGTRVSDLKPLKRLIELRHINISGTQVSDLKPIQQLTSLTTLVCVGTQVCDLTPLKRLTKLTHLDFRSTEVNDLKPLQELDSLITLACANTQVTVLNPLQRLTKLTDLDCGDTQVSDLRPIKKLTRLKTLDCSGTQVSDLKPIQKLTRLTSLVCSSTLISDLKPVQQMTVLTEIDCSNTQIRDLQPLKDLTKLTILNCSDTKVSDLTPLARLTGLSQLDSSNCHLKTVPLGFWQNTNLEQVNLHNTILPGVPDEVLASTVSGNCLPALRAHLADLGDDPEPLKDVKLMVLGNGRIGKTQICNRLRGLNFDAEADSTHGIQLTSAPIPENSGQFNIWDFGGQDIYFGTHALFLKSRAVFLLVWTPETDNSDEAEHGGTKVRNRPVSWWLGTVRRLGSPRTPLIAVQNQLDRFEDAGEHPAVATLRQEDHYCRSLSYSAKTQEGEASLKERLKYAAQEFNPPLIGKVRLAVIHQLRKLREEDLTHPPSERQHRTLSFMEFQRLCDDAGGISNTELFLNFLHNAGEVFWQQGLFGDSIILDQAWVLEAVYSVFDRTKSYQYLLSQRGCFTRDTLAMLLWDNAGYTTAEQELFLGFMQQAGICFAVRSELTSPIETTFVAPDLLPEHYADEGITGTIEGNDHTLEFPTLPPGFMRNVIVRVGRKARMNCHYWRHGFCGYDATTQSRVRVEETIRDDWSGSITITAEGTQSDPLIKKLTQWILEEAQLFGLETQEKTLRELPEKLPEPDFQPDPKRPSNYFVSYAWADEKTPDRDRIVDEFCQSAQQKGVQIRRDKDEIGLGDSISDFMSTLTKGDKILIVLTDKYLRSRNCMFELYEIWRLAKGDRADFLEKARLFSAPDAGIFTPVGRAKIARHWKTAYDEEKEFLDDMGPGDRQSHHRLKTYAAHVGEILEVIADTLQPRTLEDLLDYALT
ncbi:Internalin-A precursor [Pannonibacter phragmitetus]|uniref:Internalin-A n=1 Tax=Pannonibacter phragmitetus TaxID=121719 RepID=A0A378ZWF0_9HYPH|nr:leucine-rich repeat domain-containing protein [Pannonibacter phragmitetus]SUB01535.1 Internalin-A precursor [Pannonibacter phragmitetus]